MKNDQFTGRSTKQIRNVHSNELHSAWRKFISSC